MQTITTKYLAPTNTLGSRVKATTESGISLTIDWDYSVDTWEVHAQAIRALRKQLGWTGEMVMDTIKEGYCAVFISSYKIEGEV